MLIAFSYVDSSDHVHYRPIIQRLIELGHKVICIEGGDPNWIDRPVVEAFLSKDSLELESPDHLLTVDSVITTSTTKHIRNCSSNSYIRLFTSIGDTGLNHSYNYNKDFTALLVPGLRAKQCLRDSGIRCDVKIIGLPLLDKVLRVPCSSSFELCYAPSWGSQGSLGIFGEYIAKLRNRYHGECIFRPHVNTRISGRQWIDLFKRCGWAIFPGIESMAALARRSVVILADESSGAVWESALASEMVIACRNPNIERAYTAAEAKKYIHTVETKQELERALESLPGVKAIPLKYCDHREEATNKAVKAILRDVKKQRGK